MTSTHLRELVVKCESDASGDFILHLKQVCDVTVEALGPQMATSLSFYQLYAHSNPVLGATHAALHNVAHVQLAPNLRGIDLPAFVVECGAACDYEAARPSGQIGR